MMGSMKSGYIDEKKYKKMLGVYIREQREKLALSSAELSRKTRISSARLKRIENGEVSLREKTLEKLKTLLHMDENYLDKIEDVAKMAFVSNLIRVLNQEMDSKNGES